MVKLAVPLLRICLSSLCNEISIAHSIGKLMDNTSLMFYIKHKLDKIH